MLSALLLKVWEHAHNIMSTVYCKPYIILPWQGLATTVTEALVSDDGPTLVTFILDFCSVERFLDGI